MKIIISSSSEEPIYEQIVNQIKSQIMDETLKEGETLPSMRALAKDIHVSVITVQRAYETLQRDGFIETVVGRGTFVAPLNKEFYLEEKQRQIEEKLEEAIKIAQSCGITLKELESLLKVLYEEG